MTVAGHKPSLKQGVATGDAHVGVENFWRKVMAARKKAKKAARRRSVRRKVARKKTAVRRKVARKKTAVRRKVKARKVSARVKAKTSGRKAKRSVRKAARSVSRKAEKVANPFVSATADKVERAVAVDQSLAEPRPITSAPPAQAA